ncbi:ATP-dependent DNA ligase [Cerasicoccus fimbriatus]|uniref:ATP-dependent DNA ligase n=1 Tax=Cerasicoccus fimbriatus TaxID=3014554 RepID=UPI0022B3C1FB|nr:ATP-dependent DNA ligase [Cerasicoccus sp. TK19100]
MKAFTQLFVRLDESNRTNDKLAAMRDYFAEAEPRSAAWALWFLMGNRLKAPVKTKMLREWASQLSEFPLWMVEECYSHVGDLAETLALILPPGEDDAEDLPLWQLVEDKVMALADWDGPLQFPLVRAAWGSLGSSERFVYNKLITGGFRVGVSRTLVVRALAEFAGVERAVMEHRLMGAWRPSAENFQRLLSDEGDDEGDAARPYPFFLAYPLEGEPAELGDCADWRAEWKWDGIRAQLIKRQGQVMLWSRGEEMIAERFPEVTTLAARLPEGTVLDGELMAWRDDKPLTFAALQKRIGRTKLTAKVLEEAPVAFLVYDCLEFGGEDLRERTLRDRVTLLGKAIEDVAGPDSSILLAESVEADSWDRLAELRGESRARGVEGLMLKRWDSPYRVGRVKGDWWKWKIDPYSIDAVMVAAQAGHGRRSGLYTDYTFALWKGEELVTFAKAYSGLTDGEIARVDHWVRRHTVSRHGPVRVVEPTLVFELHFEGIAESTRHKSGLAVRFPRIARWREDKPAREADSIETVRALLEASE